MTLIFSINHTPIGESERNDRLPLTRNGEMPCGTSLLNNSLSGVAGVHPPFTLAGNDTGKQLLGETLPGVVTTAKGVISPLTERLPDVASPIIACLPGVTFALA